MTLQYHQKAEEESDEHLITELYWNLAAMIPYFTEGVNNCYRNK